MIPQPQCIFDVRFDRYGSFEFQFGDVADTVIRTVATMSDFLKKNQENFKIIL